MISGQLPRVIKLGGRAQNDPALAPALAAAWRQRPGSLAVVHGGGDEVSALLRQLGREPTFANGRRITSAPDLEIVRMVLSGTVNKRLVASLVSEHAWALGLSGEDGGLIEASLLEDGALGRVGEPSRVNTGLLDHIMSGGWLPVISPLARETGSSLALNVNGDDAAAAIAAAIGAAELLLVADVSGVLVNGIPAESLDERAVRSLISTGVATGGMIAKLEAALAALARSIPVVRIGGVEAIADVSRGTRITLGRDRHLRSTAESDRSAANSGLSFQGS